MKASAKAELGFVCGAYRLVKLDLLFMEMFENVLLPSGVLGILLADEMAVFSCCLNGGILLNENSDSAADEFVALKDAVEFVVVVAS